MLELSVWVVGKVEMVELGRRLSNVAREASGGGWSLRTGVLGGAFLLNGLVCEEIRAFWF